jgi:anti-sigma regulatory factor (Ser/Thr protein kinase)
VDQLRAALGRDADEVTFVEDTVAYAPQWNVYRVLLDFAAASPGVRSRVVAEQTLAERVPAELRDYRRLEAAASVVFAAHDVDLLCPYDAGSLPPELLEIGLHTHGDVRADGGRSHNARYDDPFDLLADLSTVKHPPPDAETIDCSSPGDVAAARRLVRARGAEAGLPPERVADLALAVTEVLTNAILHGESFALLHLYDEGATWVCHVQDGGRGHVDPLVGLLPPAGPSDHGYGLWLARQLCAAVDVGHDRTGTHVRLHTRRSGPAA